jgi:hypothetical protein
MTSQFTNGSAYRARVETVLSGLMKRRAGTLHVCFDQKQLSDKK